jgi:hypothetical protein
MSGGATSGGASSGASSRGATSEAAASGAAPSGAHTSKKAAGSGRPPAPGPRMPAARLLDATAVEAAAATRAAQELLAGGGPLTVVHPAGPEGLDLDTATTAGTAPVSGATAPDADADGEVPDLEVVAAPTVDAALAARFGPARTLRLVPVDGGAPVALVREAQPLQTIVDDLGEPDGLPPGPVFIGGTGRSGTWVLGRMLARHPRFVNVHTELRFHSSHPGFAAVLAGELTPEEFAEVVHKKWFRPKGGSGNAKGLQLISGNNELKGLLRDFRERAVDDVPGALGQLMLDVVGRYARGRGALRWSETTPDNASAAAALTTVLPTAQVIHTIRDGRDVAASVVTMPWGPTTHAEGLDWWAKRSRAADTSIAQADPERVHTVRLEELIHLDRERQYAALIEGLGFTDDALLRDYFDTKMSAEKGHVGRWRTELDAAERDAFDGRYREVLAELADEGVASLPTDPDAVDELAGA